MRIALDTNILVYASGFERIPADERKVASARAFVPRLISDGVNVVVPVQVLAELYHVLVTKAGISREEASVMLDRWRDASQTAATSDEILDAALALSSERQVQIYDAIIVAASVAAGCDILLSEDMQDGFVWRGLTVFNPFGAAPVRA